MSYDILVFAAHPDDAEVQMGGTIAKLTEQGARILLSILELYEAEDQHMGRLFGIRYAEIFRAHSPLLVNDPLVFLPGLHS